MDGSGARNQQGEIPPAQQSRLAPERPVHRRPQALFGHPFARLGRAVDVPRPRRRGVQLNEKPNWQKDLGEPAFSPDGRYIYYSQDTTGLAPRSNTTRIQTARSTPSSGATCKTTRSSPSSTARAGRCVPCLRRTANTWPSCAAYATSRPCTSRT
ncbi:hypothetical protein LP420_36200 [Massilia sp. B-10]|nr:hypothetical protein LP420_36200 [Massilia sp. B-10]